MPIPNAVREGLSEDARIVQGGYLVGEFRGDYPEIEVSPGIDRELLLQDDDDPMFATLPIARRGLVSRNGLHFDDKLIEQIEAQLVGKPGLAGHIKDEDRGSIYPTAEAFWVGFARVGETTYGKAYIPPGPFRDHVRRLKATKGTLATSIYGVSENFDELDNDEWRVQDFTLESLDFAAEERAALQLGGQFMLASEQTRSEGGESNSEEREDMPVTIDEVPQDVRDQIITAWQADRDSEAEAVQLRERAEKAEGEAKTLAEQLQQRDEQNFTAVLTASIAEQVKVDALRPTVLRAVLSEMSDPDIEKAKTVLEQYLTGDEFKALAKAVVAQESGGSAITPGQQNGSGDESGDEREFAPKTFAEQAELFAYKRGIVKDPPPAMARRIAQQQAELANAS